MKGRVGLRLLALTALALPACGDSSSSPPASLAVEITPAEATWYGTPRTITGSAITTPGLLVPTNDDDSDGVGGADNGDTVVNGADDMKQLTRFVIIKPSRTPAVNDRVHLRKASGTGSIRVFRRGATPAASNVILDTGASTTTPAEATATRNILASENAEFLVEGTATGDFVLCADWSGASTVTTCAKFDVFSGYAANFGPRVFGNSNRNTTLDWASDAAGRRTWSESSGALVFVNRDEDCTPGGARDSEDTTICAADVTDITPFKIDASRIVTVGDWKPTLWIEATQAIHVRLFGSIADGAGALTSTTETVAALTYRRFDINALVAGGGEKTLGIEGLEYDKPVKVYHCVTHLPTNVSAACDLVEFRTGRVLLQSNNEPLGKMLIGVFSENLAMRLAIAPVMPSGSVQPYSGFTYPDQWVQDELEIAGQATPHAGEQVTLHLPRGNPLFKLARETSGANFCYENLIGIDVGVVGTRPPVPTRITVTPGSENFGGNVEVGGPTTGHPGRIIVGSNMSSALVAELERMAPNQKPSIALNVSWLTVGHVDEVMAIYPVGTTDWKFAVADVKLGVQLLTAAPARHALFWHCTSSTTARSASCYGHDDVSSASAKSLSTPAKLTAKNLNFGLPSPAAKKWNYIRIYAGPGRGQVAHVSKVNGKDIEIDQVWNLPTPEWVRCASVKKKERCDHVAAGLAAPVGAAPPFWTPNPFRKDDWFVVPTSASKFVVVEETRDFNDTGSGSAAKAGPAAPAGLAHVPALISAGELSDTTFNKAFLDKQLPGIESILTSVVTALNYTGTPPVRVPALYFARDMGGGTFRWGDAYVPAIVNFQAMRTTAGTIVLAAKPYGPSAGGADPFETTSNTNLGITPTYVDDWSAYHIQSGEVHCGTNQIKASARPWW